MPNQILLIAALALTGAAVRNGLLPGGLWTDRDRTAQTLALASVSDISRSEIRALQGRGEVVILVDARSHADFEAGHLDGARNLPMGLSEFPEVIEQTLDGVSRESLVVVYCSSGCDLKRIVASKILQAGWKRVRVMKD